VEAVDWLVRGGFSVAPILVFSIVALGIFLERLWILRRGYLIPESGLKNVENLLLRKKIPEARAQCQQVHGPVARIFLAGLNKHGAPRPFIQEAMEEQGKAEAMDLKRYLGTLQTIASVCPLLGLLGTVSGMIKVFDVMSTEGMNNPGVFSAGISEALISTFVGLSVAIPTYMGQRYLMGRSARFIHVMEQHATYLLNLLTGPAAESRKEEV
jgi:biopolymer transport protein ExbB